MARIRSIKPEFPQSETIGRLSRDARLLFIQLWTIVDDDGRTRAASRMLASLLYPYDDDAPKLIDGWLAELERAGCVRRYEADGTTYLDIPNWLKHQKIDRPSKSRLPAFNTSSPKPREPSRALDADLGSRTLDKDQEGAASPPPPTGRPIGYAWEGQIIRLKQRDYDLWRQSYRDIPNFEAALQKADDYYATHPPPDGKWFFPVSRWLEKENQEHRKVANGSNRKVSAITAAIDEHIARFASAAPDGGEVGQAPPRLLSDGRR